jgi:chromosome segregation ATPase
MLLKQLKNYITMKINFTKQHMERLIDLADSALFDKTLVTTKLGQPLNIYELLHTTSINQLNEIKTSLSKRIEKMEEQDEWVALDNDKLSWYKNTKELINLIIGWKRYNLELDENARKKEELTAKLAELKESQKTPEDRIKELETQLKELEEF